MNGRGHRPPMTTVLGGTVAPRTCTRPIRSPGSTAWDWSRCWIHSGASRRFHEPPDAEPHVRWCGRTAGVTPPPTRLGECADLRPLGHPWDQLTCAAFRDNPAPPTNMLPRICLNAPRSLRRPLGFPGHAPDDSRVLNGGMRRVGYKLYATSGGSSSLVSSRLSEPYFSPLPISTTTPCASCMSG